MVAMQTFRHKTQKKVCLCEFAGELHIAPI